jgi:phenylalanyl-tRNA synthetase beta chain
LRVPLSWLREWVDWEGHAQELAELLTKRGLAVEALEGPAHRPEGIVAATVLAVEPHPGADRLRVCRVRAGERQATVVCGAPDVRAGMLAPWAVPGAVLPGGKRIAPRPVRGVLSEGMLCAPDELGLPGGHEGLLALDGETRADGRPLAEGDDLVEALALDDVVLVLELTPNYAAHCQSVLGVARELSAATGAELRWPPMVPGEDGRHVVSGAAWVSVEAPDLCPRYVARVCSGMRHGPSPLWLRRRLEQGGMRPIGLVVDVTNYVMLELGQPLHAFDLDRLAGGGAVVRRARAGERLVTLDGRERELDAGDLVIADQEGPVAIAGIMGGQRTEVGGTTQAVLLESATFSAEAVARTARRLALATEASSRFARGVDPGMARRAADRAMLLLRKLGGATVYAGALEAGPGVPERHVALRGRYVRGLLGVDLSTPACGRLLERLGFTVRPDGADRLRVTVPGWRPDVVEEVDLVEEVARQYGYDRLPAALPPGDPGTPAPSPLARVAEVARSVALAAGFSEVQPYSFHGAELWDRMRLPAEHPWRRATAVTNPMGADQAYLRTTLAGGLLRTLGVNARYRRPDAAAFEVGRVFRPPRPGARPDEPLLLGLGGYGALRPGGWDHRPEPCDFFALKGVLEEIFSRAGLRETEPTWVPAPDAYPTLHPGRCAEARLNGTVLAWVGEVHPEVRAAFDLPAPAALAELDLGALAGAATEGIAFQAPPRHPAVRRDVAILVPRSLPAAEVARTLRRAGSPLLAEVRLFDVYTGEGVPEGMRSLAYALTYRAEDRTLTDAEVDAAHAAVRQALAELPGVRLRS